MLDREPEELQYLGAWGIVREARNVFKASRKQFMAITLTLILPLSFVILAHTLVSDSLLKKIQTNEDKFEREGDGPEADRTLNALSSEWTRLLLFQAGYFVFLFAFSLLSTAAVVYAVACIYTGKQTTYSKVMSVVPKVWKRLIMTFLWYFLIMVVYNTVLFLVLIFLILMVGTGSMVAFWTCVVVLVTVFVAVHVYMSALWHLGSVISVLEDQYGLGAFRKSGDLIKGKRIIAFVMVFLYFVMCGVINGVFSSRVVHGSGALSRIFWGIFLVGSLVVVNLTGLLVQSVFYYVCKSYHHQSIDKSALSDHLEEYLGEYVPLKSSIQMENLDV
ncbi:hypothetical protein SUGI_0818100 [Cryptomeria japonica]|uniref:uncharacterized protein LOC131027602 n=1 Tax=Cryptomeria japonica TaxID=3369 RepID=UPI002414863D|nr:uncharacterized protein LOC131027602 [Cryptomeria japonica]GLJ39984.1 hypothetical protein SUGI_0818100 [Cryptomeria japonica]